MMITRTAIFLILLLAGCSTLQVQTDRDPEFDFTALRQFAVVAPQKDGITTLTQTRITEAITRTMQTKGYRLGSKDTADFVITFHTDITTKQQVVTDYQAVGYYPYYGYRAAPMMVPVQREYTYNEGQMIIDTLTPGTRKIFWRGIAADELRSLETPQERIDYINTVVGKLLKSFPAVAGTPAP